MQIHRQTLFAGSLLDVVHVIARPTSERIGELEQQPSSVVVFPLAGVFARHDGPRKHEIATPLHAMCIAPARPYRLSFPGALGDESIALRISAVDRERVLPTNSHDAFARMANRILPPKVLLARALFWRSLSRGESDPLDIEEAAVALLSATIDERGEDAANIRDSARRRSIERVKAIVSLRPEKKWTLEDLAQAAHLSPYHLAHVFRRDVGVSVYRYVLRARLARALDAVLETDRHLTAIAADAGFATHSHLTARFRELFGITPRQLRLQANTKNAAELRKIVTAPNTAAT